LGLLAVLQEFDNDGRNSLYLYVFLMGKCCLVWFGLDWAGIFASGGSDEHVGCVILVFYSSA